MKMFINFEVYGDVAAYYKKAGSKDGLYDVYMSEDGENFTLCVEQAAIAASFLTARQRFLIKSAKGIGTACKVSYRESAIPFAWRQCRAKGVFKAKEYAFEIYLRNQKQFFKIY